MQDSNAPDAAGVASHFPEARFSAGQWRIPCPSADHGGDGGVNCVIGDGERGGLVAFCHSHHCSHKSIMAGLEECGALPKRTWTYASGKAVHRIPDRQSGKRIFQDQGAQAGEPLLRGDIDGEAVVVVEGEAAADAVLSACGPGYAVLTWRGGASAADRADLACTRDKTVLVWPDNDAQGKAAMEVIARRCWGAGAYAVRIIEISGGDKWDAADLPSVTVKRHIEGGGRPDPEGPMNLAGIQSVAPTFVVDPLVLRHDVSFLSGPGGSGKTRLVLSMLGVMSSGGDVFGHPDLPVDGGGRGILITGGEERPETLKWMDPTADCDVLTTTSAWTDDQGNLTDTAHAHMEMCLIRNYSLVVLDSISNLYHANENDRGQVNTFIYELRAYAYRGLSILLIGHTSRQNDRWSGSTGWQTGPRSHLTIRPDGDNPDVKIITLEKANRAKAGQEWRVTNIQPDGSFGPWREAPESVTSGDDPLPDKVTLFVQAAKAEWGVTSDDWTGVKLDTMRESLGWGQNEAMQIRDAAIDQGMIDVDKKGRPWRYRLPS